MGILVDNTNIAMNTQATTKQDEMIELCSKLATIISDYRADETSHVPNLEHVNRWIQQFDENMHLPLLREIHHLFGPSGLYFSSSRIREQAIKYLQGKDAGFWSESYFLDLMQGGRDYSHEFNRGLGMSHKRISGIWDGLLRDHYNLQMNTCGRQDGSRFICIDDFLFNGAQLRKALTEWIHNKAPSKAQIWIILLGWYKYGKYRTEIVLREASIDAGKEIDLVWLPRAGFENRMARKNVSQTLWPLEPSDPEVVEYVKLHNNSGKHYRPFEPRDPNPVPDQALPPFSSGSARNLIEQQMLAAGIKILAPYKILKSDEGISCWNPEDEKPYWKPLGYSPYGLGFGSMHATCFNCPNTAPLALWWGLESQEDGGRANWYPLLGRRPW